MTIKRQRQEVSYGLNQPLVGQPPEPIIAQRSPQTTDYAQVGSLWLDQTGNDAYVLLKIVAGIATWQTLTGDVVFDNLLVTGTLTVNTAIVNNGSYSQTGGVFQVTTGTNSASAITLITAGGAADEITIQNTLGTGTTAINLLADFGGINIVSQMNNPAAINIATNGGVTEAISLYNNQGTANDSIRLDSTDGGITVISAKAAATAVNIRAQNAVGGIQITTAGGEIFLGTTQVGNIQIEGRPGTVAGVAIAINAFVGHATFTGQTTAAAASQVFTITNANVTADTAMLVTVSNIGANDAQMTLTRVKQGVGSFEVTARNDGAAALNGDVIITWMIIL